MPLEETDIELVELMRKALHKDGSSETVGVSSEAVMRLDALTQGDGGDHVRSLMERTGFNRAKPGFYPDEAAFAAYLAKLPPAPVAARPPAAPHVPAGPVVNITPAPAPAFFAAAGAGGYVNGPVVADAGALKIRVLGVLLSITDALIIERGVIAAARRLQIPAEGFEWVDDMLAVGETAKLWCMDRELFEGLAIEVIDGAGLAGEIAQDPDTAVYHGSACRSIPKALGTDDFNDAKAMICELVRTRLEALKAAAAPAGA